MEWSGDRWRKFKIDERFHGSNRIDLLILSFLSHKFKETQDNAMLQPQPAFQGPSSNSMPFECHMMEGQLDLRLPSIYILNMFVLFRFTLIKSSYCGGPTQLKISHFMFAWTLTVGPGYTQDLTHNICFQVYKHSTFQNLILYSHIYNLISPQCFLIDILFCLFDE